MRARPKVHPNTMARVRREVHTRDGFKCLNCGWAPVVPEGWDGSRALSANLPGKCLILELDHVVPYSLGGKFHPDNLQTLCNSCNVRKGTKV